MAMNFPEPGGNYEPAPAGMHRSALVGIYDIGTHMIQFDPSKPAAPKRQVILTWELSDEEMTDGRPFTLSRTFTFSGHEKAGLRIMVEGWLARKFTDESIRKFDLFSLAGRAGLLNVTHTAKGDRVYANVQSVNPLAKGMATPGTINEIRTFSLDEDQDIPEGTPKFIVEKIHSSEEWAARSEGYGPGVAKGQTVRSAPAPEPVAAGVEDDDLNAVPY